MRKLFYIVIPILLIEAATAWGQRDTTVTLGGMKLAEMKIELSYGQYGTSSGSRRLGPNDYSEWSSTGPFIHSETIDLLDTAFEYSRVGDHISITSGDYRNGSFLRFSYDSSNAVLRDVEYSMTWEAGSFCQGGFLTIYRMTESPVRTSGGRLIVDPYAGSDWRSRVVSWHYLLHQDCPVPYHNSHSEFLSGDSLVSPIELKFSTAASNVPIETEEDQISYHLSADALKLEFGPGDEARQLTITDVIGRELFRATVPANIWSTDIPLLELPSGMLLIRLGNATSKIAM